MGVKPGYKQTEVGVIPEDWGICEFQEVMTGFSSGQTPSRIRPEYYTGSIPWITSGELNYGIITDTFEKITFEALEKTNLKIIPKGTFLFAITGLEAEGTRGSCGITGIDAATNQSCMALYPKNGLLSTEYLFHFYIRQGDWLALKYCQGTKQQSYNGHIAKKLPIIFPPTLAEQTAIATALSDADALIQSLERLIAKKRGIKQGAMQELLTGKKRLPGFSGEWGSSYLRDVLSYERPDRYIVQNTEYLDYGDMPVLTANKSFILGYTNEDFGICQNIPAIVFDDFTTDCKFASFPFKVKSSAIKLLRPRHSEVDLRYIYGRMQLIQFAIGDHKRYYISEYQNLEINVPDYKEQTAIATVLSDMDAEIAALDSKLAKARQIKQGMMQELLTGRIRLT